MPFHPSQCLRAASHMLHGYMASGSLSLTPPSGPESFHEQVVVDALNFRREKLLKKSIPWQLLTRILSLVFNPLCDGPPCDFSRACLETITPMKKKKKHSMHNIISHKNRYCNVLQMHSTLRCKG